MKFDGSRSFGVRKSWVGRSEMELSLAMREGSCERWAILQSALVRRAGVRRASAPSIAFGGARSINININITTVKAALLIRFRPFHAALTNHSFIG